MYIIKGEKLIIPKLKPNNTNFNYIVSEVKVMLKNNFYYKNFWTTPPQKKPNKIEIKECLICFIYVGKYVGFDLSEDT